MGTRGVFDNGEGCWENGRARASLAIKLAAEQKLERGDRGAAKRLPLAEQQDQALYISSSGVRLEGPAGHFLVGARDGI